MSQTKPPSGDFLFCLILSLLTLPVYLAASSPLLFWRDSSEFAMLGHNLDIGHPAGSPAFSMIEKALDLLPLGSIAFRPALLTILLAALAAGLMAWIVLRVAAGLGLPWPMAELSAIFATSLFAFSPAYFDWIAAPEVYSGQVAAILAVLALALMVREGEDSGLADRRYVFAAGFILGLSFGMHMGMILLVPGLAVILFFPNRSVFNFRDVFLFGFFLLLGFSVFLFLPIRSAADVPFDQGNPEFAGAFLAHITGRRYTGIIHSFPWPRIFFNLRSLAGHFPDQLTWTAVILAPVGLFVATKKNFWILVGLLLVVFGHLYLYIKDWERAFGYIPLFALAALLAGIGAAAVFARLYAALRPASMRWSILAGFVVLAASIAYQTTRALADHSRATHDLAHRHVRGILDSLPENAAYVSYLDSNSYTVFYMQSVERYRQDVVHIQRAHLGYVDYLEKRFPEMNWTGYDPDAPYAAQKALLANARAHDPYWDYGWEDGPFVEPAALTPHGFVYRVTEPKEGPPDDRREVFDKYFGAVLKDVSKFPYDFTVKENYSKHFSVLAKLHFDRGDRDGAERNMREALAVGPEFGQLYAQLGFLLARAGKPKEAFLNAVTATKLEPYQPANWNYRAAFAGEAGFPEDVEPSLRRSLALNRRQSPQAAQLGAMLLAKRNFREASSRARDALAGAGNDAERKHAREILARALVGQKRFDKAEKVLRDILADDPKNEQARLLLEYVRK